MIYIDHNELVERMMEAGLTGYQSRAYLTLLRMRSAKVLALSRESGIPRNKLYHVLEELENMGLVEVRQQEPLEYSPRPIEPFISRRIERLGEILKELARESEAPLSQHS